MRERQKKETAKQINRKRKTVTERKRKIEGKTDNDGERKMATTDRH